MVDEEEKEVLEQEENMLIDTPRAAQAQYRIAYGVAVAKIRNNIQFKKSMLEVLSSNTSRWFDIQQTPFYVLHARSFTLSDYCNDNAACRDVTRSYTYRLLSLIKP